MHSDGFKSESTEMSESSRQKSITSQAKDREPRGRNMWKDSVMVNDVCPLGLAMVPGCQVPV